MPITIQQRYMTNNDCYKQGRTIVPAGILVHSTATPGVRAAAWYDRWNKPDVAKAVHAMLDNAEILQYLPWTMRGWHAGSGSKGSANNTHIGFEICEPAGFTYGSSGSMVGYDPKAQQPYFDAIWNNSVFLCVELCRMFRLTEKNILCHSEAHTAGLASNHADVMHWFPMHGKNMDLFRADVHKALNESTTEPEEDEMTQEQFNTFMNAYNQSLRAMPASGWSQAAWDKMTKLGFMDGTAPRSPLTREQLALVADRLGLLDTPDPPAEAETVD